VLGEAVLGACPKALCNESGYNAEKQAIRRDGTSTAAPIAAGIAALLFDYMYMAVYGWRWGLRLRTLYFRS
jgi:hypothetical protein